MQKTKENVDEFLSFLTRSSSPYHAVQDWTQRLLAQGFTYLKEEDSWNLEANGRYFLVRGGTSIVAFVMGKKAPAEAGFHLLGAHTDSPGFKLKPQPMRHTSSYSQLSVEVYGSPIFATWLDRDLGIAGCLWTQGPDSTLISHLVCSKQPILRIPSLAIHYQREVNQQGMVLHPQFHLLPVLDTLLPQTSFSSFLQHISGLEREELDGAYVGHDLFLYDTQAPVRAGLDGEFIYAGRLDNLLSADSGIRALLETAPTPSERTRLVACYDHEEVGSVSAKGAASSFLSQILLRLVAGDTPALARACARSFFISADMAHAMHPNYAELHDPAHAPMMGKGPVLKTNANQRYATDAFSSAYWMRLCQQAGIPLQHFTMRNDLGCGSTIGPVSAAQLGIPTVDIGNPMWSMHSIREMASVTDYHYLQRVLKQFFYV